MKLRPFLTHPDLLGATFNVPSRANWLTIADVLDGTTLSKKQKKFFEQASGRVRPIAKFVKELYDIAGRRSGKTTFCAGVAVHAAAQDYSEYLAVGERATIAVIAADKRQAGVLFGYIRGMIAASPVLANEVVRETASEIELRNGNTIEIHTCSFRSTRGRTYALVIFDEAAFFRDENSASPDIELRRAILPGLATIPTSRLIVISSPWARRGLVYNMHARHFAKESSSILVLQAETRLLNPTFDQGVIDEAMEEDAIAARTEYGAQFREDISQAIPDSDIDAAIVPGCTELSPLVTLNGAQPHYVAFCDMSGGRHDAATLAIAHADGERLILDCLRVIEAPFEPQAAVSSMAQTLKRYGLTAVMGDRYGAEWIVSAFSAAGIAYHNSERDRSTLFLECLPLFSDRRLALLDSPRLISELRGLERRPKPGGRDAITHGPGGHDDAANSACGALWRASRMGVSAQPATLIHSTMHADLQAMRVGEENFGRMFRET